MVASDPSYGDENRKKLGLKISPNNSNYDDANKAITVTGHVTN